MLKEIKKILNPNALDRIINQMSKDESKIDERDLKDLVKTLDNLKNDLPGFIKQLKNIQN